MRGFGLQRQRPVADQLRIAAVLLRKIGRWMPQYAMILPAICYAQRGGMLFLGDYHYSKEHWQSNR